MSARTGLGCEKLPKPKNSTTFLHTQALFQSRILEALGTHWQSPPAASPPAKPVPVLQLANKAKLTLEVLPGDCILQHVIAQVLDGQAFRCGLLPMVDAAKHHSGEATWRGGEGQG